MDRRQPYFLFRRLRALRQNEGQVVVEYVLLLVVALLIAASMTKLMVSRNRDSPGVLIMGWQKLIEAVGADATEYRD